MHRVCFVDYQWEKWREIPSFLTPRQAHGVVEFLTRNAGAYRCVIHCTAGASRSVSMAMALEAEGFAVYDKPEWWGKIPGENDPAQGWIPNPGVFARICEAVRSAERSSAPSRGDAGGTG